MASDPLVLVVDDYADARAMYAAWLQLTAAQAIALAFAEPPAAVLMDLSLPGLDGLEATRRLKTDPRTAHVPVVAITGHVESKVADAARAAGCDTFIVKPSPATVVVDAVTRLIRQAETAS